MIIDADRFPRAILGLSSLLLLISVPAYGVEIDDVLWGFDGTATGRSFLPVHVLVRNEATDAFTGFLVLEKEVQLGNRVGAPMIEPVALAPGQQSWVPLLRVSGQRRPGTGLELETAMERDAAWNRRAGVISQAGARGPGAVARNGMIFPGDPSVCRCFPTSCSRRWSRPPTRWTPCSWTMCPVGKNRSGRPFVIGCTEAVTSMSCREPVACFHVSRPRWTS